MDKDDQGWIKQSIYFYNYVKYDDNIDLTLVY